MTSRTVLVDGSPFLYASPAEAEAALAGHIARAAAQPGVTEINHGGRRLLVGAGAVKVRDLPGSPLRSAPLCRKVTGMSTTTAVTTPTGTYSAEHATLAAGKATLDRWIAEALRAAYASPTGTEQTLALRAGAVARTVIVRSAPGRSVTVTDFDARGTARTWTAGEPVACLQRHFGADTTEAIRGAA